MTALAEARLVMRGVHKRFGATAALAGVDLSVAGGEVHALIGENGAGKSTLMKVLAGVHVMDEGTLELDGSGYVPKGPIDARRRGVVMIHQELNLAPHLSAAENIALGEEPRLCWGLINGSRRRDTARDALARLGCESIPIDVPVAQLSVAQQQMVEIARALTREPRVLVMDEPTSSLTRDDVDSLFAVIRRLREQGVSVIYISHFLEECQEICDRYTVLRDGATVTTGSMAEADLSAIIAAMVGRSVEELYPRSQHQMGEVLVTVDDLAGAELPVSASFTLHAGEVAGVFGLVGSGRTEMLRCIYGLASIRHGSVQVAGQPLGRSSPRLCLHHGLGLLSEDRKSEGLMLTQSIADNVALPDLARYARVGMLNNAAMDRGVSAVGERLGVKCQSVQQGIGELSGGNQQKAALARLIHHEAEILLLDEPTRGVDVGSKAAIYALIDQLASEGKAVLVVSSYIPELLGICDRIGVMCKGQLGGLRPRSEWDEHTIMAAAIGQEVRRGQ